MIDVGYCEKHQRAFEIKCIHGSWAYECPECRKEGAYNTYATTMTELKPAEEWTVTNYSIPPRQPKLYGRSATDN